MVRKKSRVQFSPWAQGIIFKHYFYGTRKFGENEMRGVQKHKLFHDSKQEKNKGKTGSKEILQEMQEAHDA